jgi:uncharacterized short protein YbdD (DUF466 family)
MLARRNEGKRERGKEGTVPHSLLPSFLSVLRRIAGMPDYEAYVAHVRRCHPERPLPSEREFYEEFVRNRYSEGATRCC